jgi:hypothetical protein
VNDGDEPDDTLALARPADLDGGFEGVICQNDKDHIAVEVDSPSRLTATILFDPLEADLDLELYSPAGALIVGSWGSLEEETVEAEVAAPGTYVLRVVPYGSGSTSYLGEVTLEAIAGCSTDQDCPIGTMCDTGACVNDACDAVEDCPNDHLCPTAGPDEAPRHCSAVCEFNADCRDTAVTPESCKWFPEGRACGRRGSAANGAACTSSADCGGQRACLDLPGGYCARANCFFNEDCETDTFCAEVVVGQWACVRRCGVGLAECRLAEGYECFELLDGDLEYQTGCALP